MPKNIKGWTLWDFLNIHSVGKYQKIEGRPFGFFEKKVSEPKKILYGSTRWPPLSFLDDVKILLRKQSKNCKKSGPFRVRLSGENTTHCNSRAFSLREKAPTKNSVNCGRDSKLSRSYRHQFLFVMVAKPLQTLDSEIPTV